MKKQIKKALFLCLACGFLLGIHDGYLTLWEEPDPRPCHSFYVRVEDLPPTDQLLLRRGIRVENERELYAILENYL